jgi:trehalose 6-phosphate phosphatase
MHDPMAILSSPIDLDAVALLLDVDGTLIDLAPTPDAVSAPASLKTTLAALARRTGGSCALVSGRRVGDLDRIFAPLRMPAVGGHGVEFRLDPLRDPEPPRAPALAPEIRRRLHGLAPTGTGVLVEDKGYAVAVHFRLAPEWADTVLKAVAAIQAELPPGTIEVLPGKAVLEIKPAAFSKGTAIRELMAVAPFRGRRPIFIGDDTTDEHAFAVLPEFDGIGISVGRSVPGIAACLPAPSDVRHWLARILGDA